MGPPMACLSDTAAIRVEPGFSGPRHARLVSQDAPRSYDESRVGHAKVDCIRRSVSMRLISGDSEVRCPVVGT
jgi:hypothetical protein